MNNYKDQHTILSYLMLENAIEFIELSKQFSMQKPAYNIAADNRTVLSAEIKIGHSVLLLLKRRINMEKPSVIFYLCRQCR